VGWLYPVEWLASASAEQSRVSCSRSVSSRVCACRWCSYMLEGEEAPSTDRLPSTARLAC
jgi:hypothetical protein